MNKLAIHVIAAVCALMTASTDGCGCGNQELLDRISTLEKTMKKLQSTCCTIKPEPPVIEPPKPPQMFISCEAIKAAKPSSPSGKYDITINGKTVNVYCNMDPLCDDSKGGWMRVAYLDMKDAKQQCPAGFRLYQHESGVRACGKHRSGCQSVRFPSIGYKYSQVCGRVHGYQKGSTDGLYDSVYSHLRSINDAYVDGVSLTRGNPRKHIWTFISGLTEKNVDNRHGCPCSSNRPGDLRPPSFIGSDYFCESGAPGHHSNVLYTSDRLWDGQNCRSSEQSCCKHRNAPWFKKYTGPTTDQIELRVCANEGVDNEDVPVDYYEIYVK